MAAKQSTSPFVWVILLLMLGAFVALVLFLDQQIGKSSGREPAPTSTQDPASETRPVIDFYQVLKDREVEISISDEDQAGIDNPSINKEVSGKSILQVGSFQSADEAESLKAELAFLGLQANVQTAKVKDDTWHRVQLGPFSSETKLSQARNLLIENQIKYMQRSLP
jgi:cell division protein FtsN